MVMMRSLRVVRPFWMQTSCDVLLMDNVELVGEREREREREHEHEQGNHV